MVLQKVLCVVTPNFKIYQIFIYNDLSSKKFGIKKKHFGSKFIYFFEKETALQDNNLFTRMLL